jgi:hypothetical protein
MLYQRISVEMSKRSMPEFLVETSGEKENQMQ